MGHFSHFYCAPFGRFSVIDCGKTLDRSLSEGSWCPAPSPARRVKFICEKDQSVSFPWWERTYRPQGSFLGAPIGRRDGCERCPPHGVSKFPWVQHGARQCRAPTFGRRHTALTALLVNVRQKAARLAGRLTLMIETYQLRLQLS